MGEFVVNGIRIKYSVSVDNVHIENSYRVKRVEDMRDILIRIRASTMYQYKRTDDSWVNEWLAHNWLYSLGYEKERTGSVDLSEKESKWRRFVYSVIALFC